MGFMVVTQCCDLQHGKAQHLAIAPIRTLSSYVSEVAVEALRSTDRIGVHVSDKALGQITNETTRLLNNNCPGFFFLRGDQAHGMPANGVAFLRLKLGFRSRHMPELLAAKCGQLDSNFRSKLGWLLGNIYSRVGTRDWDHLELRGELANALESLNAYPKKVFDAARERAVELHGDDAEAHFPLVANEVMESYLQPTDYLRKAVVEAWPNNVPNAQMEKFWKRLISRQEIKKALAPKV